MERVSLAPLSTPFISGWGLADKKLHTMPDKKDTKQSTQTRSAGNLFLTMALTMSWQLAIVILVPILVGVQLDKTLKTNDICTIVGLGLALIGSVAVMWRAMQTANRLPVPKLTAQQKRAIQKSYEDEDNDE